MKIRNLGIAVRPIEKKVQEVNGIIIPETATVSSKNKEGIVVAVGEGTKSTPMEVAVNDHILYKKDFYPTSDGCEIIRLDDVLFVM